MVYSTDRNLYKSQGVFHYVPYTELHFVLKIVTEIVIPLVVLYTIFENGDFDYTASKLTSNSEFFLYTIVNITDLTLYYSLL